MLPIIQHRDYLSLRNKPEGNWATSPSTQVWAANQNCCLLPFQYGQFLNKEMLSNDAMYALSEVFRLSAASEAQFLNLMRDQIEHELEISTKLDNASMVNLRYLKKILDDHASRLAETVLVLSSQDQFAWPRAALNSDEREDADCVKRRLLIDFKYLLQRTETLSTSCEKGMQSLVNTAAFRESAKSVANAERVGQLTLLGTIFVPLSFTCSAFGMNFKVFGQGELAMWIFFPTAAGVMLILYLLWYSAAPRASLRPWSSRSTW